jgi:ubiquinone/menaquinone biosynthesis C-methylase UbiE
MISDKIIAALIGAFGGIMTTFIVMFQIEIRNNAKALVNKLRKQKKIISNDSKYCIQHIPDILKDMLHKNGVNIEYINFKDGLTLNDIEKFCKKVYYCNIDGSILHDRLKEARAIAFTNKYSEPSNEDEKLIELEKINVDGIQSWEKYFYRVLKQLDINNINDLDVLDVGIGHGATCKNLYKNIKSIKAVDISEKALSNAKYLIPHVEIYVNDAEDLISIPTSSIDLYLSFRTYQSTLFDKRDAIHEAYRVLRTGGICIISIPFMYLKSDGEVLQGLIPPGSKEISVEYAIDIAERIEKLLKTLNFKHTGISRVSPFEIYVYGKR